VNDIKERYMRDRKISFKDEADIEAIKKAGRLALKTLALVEELIKPGIKTDDINTLVHNHTIKNGAVPAPLNYRGFPKSVCVSVNEEICHGIPGDRILKDGDIVNVDITPKLNGYYADVNKTFFVGIPGTDARKIVQVARKSLKAGLSMVGPGKRIGDIGWAIQSIAEREGCSVVREFVGHGVGFEFHEAPQIPHYGQRGKGILLIPGMVFTIEPMINLGKRDLHILDDNWTAVTDDGSLSAQFEQTVLVTNDGFESLTPYDLDAPLFS
jgi:methionyl aminopeptidase